MFNEMGQAFMQREFEFRNPPDTRYSLTSFLMRFDAIFTLNQDTLLEQKYIPFVGPPKGGRAHLPGVKYLGNPQLTGSVHDRIAVMEPNPGDFRLSPGVQPYIQAPRVNELERWAERRTYPHHGRPEGRQHQPVPHPELVSPRIPQHAHATERSPYGHRVQLQ
jgi:hypothetical protein